MGYDLPMVRLPRRAVLAALALASAAAACGDGASRPKSVLLISIDSTRRDMLGAYGYDSPLAPGLSPSPSLDALAAEGVLMRDAYANTSWTLPAHMSLLSGQAELVHGVEIDWLRPDPKLRTLASVLRARGYRTAGFYSGPYLDARFGFDQGFERYEACYGGELASASARLAEALAAGEEALARGDADAARAAREEAQRVELLVDALSHRDRSSRSVADAACGALEQLASSGEPFFLFAHFFDPHYDYVPPPEHDLFDPGYGGTLTGEDFWTNPAIAEFDTSLPAGRKRVASERDLDHLRALYAGDVHATDAEVGRLLARLDELGLKEDTLVIVTSDHGDEFFEHGAIGHRRTLCEEVVRIPLLLRLPGVLPSGVAVGGLVSNHDVFGTVLELLGLPAVPGAPSRSMVPLIRGEDRGERSVFARLVRTAAGALSAPRGDGRVDLPGQLVTVEETFRLGALKVLRRRQWAEATSPPADVVADLAHARDEQRARETLLWIDVERYPDEPDAAFSADFGSPGPRAALQAFHDRYAELQRARGAARVAADAVPLAGMAGLGYTESAGPAVASDLFTLPPPGHELLRTGR
jgi:arylsulfatase A-like enzyme